MANHDGNLSVRVQQDRLVVTATGMSKADMTLDDLVVVDGAGQKIAGRRRAFSELVNHLAVYNQRADVQAVVHAHCPYATAFGTAGLAIPHPGSTRGCCVRSGAARNSLYPSLYRASRRWMRCRTTFVGATLL